MINIQDIKKKIKITENEGDLLNFYLQYLQKDQLQWVIVIHIYIYIYIIKY